MPGNMNRNRSDPIPCGTPLRNSVRSVRGRSCFGMSVSGICASLDDRSGQVTRACGTCRTRGRLGSMRGDPSTGPWTRTGRAPTRFHRHQPLPHRVLPETSLCAPSWLLRLACPAQGHPTTTDSIRRSARVAGIAGAARADEAGRFGMRCSPLRVNHHHDTALNGPTQPPTSRLVWIRRLPAILHIV